MLAKAVANHTTATFIRMVGSEFVQKYLGSYVFALLSYMGVMLRRGSTDGEGRIPFGSRAGPFYRLHR